MPRKEAKKTIFGYQAPALDPLIDEEQQREDGPVSYADDPLSKTIMDPQPLFSEPPAPAPEQGARPTGHAGLAPSMQSATSAYRSGLAAPASLPSNAPMGRVTLKTDPMPPRPGAAAKPVPTRDDAAYKETMVSPLPDAKPVQAPWPAPPPGQAPAAPRAAPGPIPPVVQPPIPAPPAARAPGPAPIPAVVPAPIPAPMPPPSVSQAPSASVQPPYAAAPSAPGSLQPSPGPVDPDEDDDDAGSETGGLAAAGQDTDSDPLDDEAEAQPGGEVVQPGRTLIRVLMALAGLLLMGMFFAPWGGTSSELVFSWNLLKGMSGLAFVAHIFLAAGGLVMLAGALIPLPYTLRALVALALGLTPLVLQLVDAPAWQPIVTRSGLLLALAALLHRRRYRGSILSRIFVVLGIAAMVAPLVIPGDSGVPLVGLFKGLSSATGLALAVQAMPLYLLAVCLLSLMALRGRRSGGLAGLWFLLLLLFLPSMHGLTLAGRLVDGDELLTVLPDLYRGISMLIFVFMASFGFSQLLAKKS